MEYSEIINLMKEMNQAGITKLEIETEGFRLCMEQRGLAGHLVQKAMRMPGETGTSASSADSPVQAGQNQPSSTAKEVTAPNDMSGSKKILSPMVGTFYSAPSPDKPAFVKVGDTVRKGQIVCIIEAMKLMNEIESEQDGEIVEILVKNEDMVEFGQPLFLLK